MELTYPSQRPQSPSLSPYFLLVGYHDVLAQLWIDAAMVARKTKIALIARIRPLPAILSVYVLSSRAIEVRNLSPTLRGCTDCKGDDFTAPVEWGTPLSCKQALTFGHKKKHYWNF